MNVIGNVVKRVAFAGKTAIFCTEKHAPEILVVSGVVLGIGACVGACKATLKAEEVLDDIKEDLDTVKEAREKVDEETYSKDDYAKDLMIAYGRGGLRFLKLYWKPILMGTAAIACTLGGFGILKRRHISLVAAYGGLKQSYDALYSRIEKEFSPEAAKRFSSGIYNEEIEIQEKDEEGNVKTRKEKADIVKDDMELGKYEFIFGPDCRAWADNFDYNLQFVKSHGLYANDDLLLKEDKILTASEILSKMDMKHIPRDFYVVGWKLPKDYYVDTVSPYIQWDIRTIYKDYQDGNGPVKAILINMNCDGYVWDKIPK